MSQCFARKTDAKLNQVSSNARIINKDRFFGTFKNYIKFWNSSVTPSDKLSQFRACILVAFRANNLFSRVCSQIAAKWQTQKIANMTKNEYIWVWGNEIYCFVGILLQRSLYRLIHFSLLPWKSINEILFIAELKLSRERVKFTAAYCKIVVVSSSTVAICCCGWNRFRVGMVSELHESKLLSSGMWQFVVSHI
jgi:hypothetical protein